MKKNVFSLKIKAFAVTLIIAALLSAACAAGLYFYIGRGVQATESKQAFKEKLVLGGSFVTDDIASDQDYKFSWLSSAAVTVYVKTPNGEFEQNDGAVKYDGKRFGVVGAGVGKIVFEHPVDKTVKFEFPYETKFVSPDTEKLVRDKYPVFYEDGLLTADELKKIAEIDLTEAREYDLSDFATHSALERIIASADGVVTLRGAALDGSVKIYVNPERYAEYMAAESFRDFAERIFPAVNTDESFINMVLDLDGGNLAGAGGELFLACAERASAPLAEYFPYRDGYTFVGWSSGGMLLGADAVLNDDIKLRAVWNENGYTVEYADSRFGTEESALPPSERVKYTQELRISDGLERTGYEFLGWRHGNELFEPGSVAKGLAGKNKDGETYLLEAAWKASEYDIVYDKNCGDEVAGLPPVQSGVPYDEQVSLSTDTPERRGYEFSGWSFTSTGGVDNAPGDKVIGLSANGAVTLYAVWKAKKYTVTFDSTGGEAVSPIVAEFGSEYTLLEPKRYKYHCIGWYFSDGTKCPARGVWNTAGDVTLYARWKPNTGVLYGNGIRINVYNDSPKSNDCDTINLKQLFGFSIAEYIQMGYTKLSVTLTVTISENEKGYQDVYFGTKARTTDCVWKQTGIEHGGTKLEKNPGDHAFKFELPLSKCADVMYVNYGSHGSSGLWWGNDWVKHALQLVMFVS